MTKSERWGNPREKLLHGEAWQALVHLTNRHEAMLQLSRQLDSIWRAVADRFDENTEVSICTDGKPPSLVISNLDKLEESLSLKTLNRRVKQLIPPVDLTELLLEVDAW